MQWWNLPNLLTLYYYHLNLHNWINPLLSEVHNSIEHVPNRELSENTSIGIVEPIRRNNCKSNISLNIFLKDFFIVNSAFTTPSMKRSIKNNNYHSTYKYIKITFVRETIP